MGNARYKNLMRVLLKEIFSDNETDWELIEQIILRYAYKDGYVIANNDFELSKKGINLINGV